MPFDEQTLRTQIAAINRELATIDLPALQQAAQRTENDREANRARLTNPKSVGLAAEITQPEWERLCSAAKAAAARHQEAIKQHGRLTQDRARLDSLVRHEEIGAEARQHHAAATSKRDAAAAALTSAEQTLATIKDMIRAERDSHTKATESAAARLLAMVKAGKPPAQVDTASSDRIATMELSQATAEGEVLQAHQALSQAEREVEKTNAQILVAEARGSELRYLAAQEAYAEALAGYAVAHYRDHRQPFVVPDLRVHAQQAMAKAGL